MPKRVTSIITILLLCVACVGLGGLYIFFPREATTDDPRFTAKLMRTVEPSEYFPYFHFRRYLRITYHGDGIVLVQAISKKMTGSSVPTLQVHPGSSFESRILTGNTMLISVSDFEMTDSNDAPPKRIWWNQLKVTYP